MINLLPPEVKHQIFYSKKNRQLIKVGRLLALLAIVIAACFAAGHWQLQRTMAKTQTEYQQKQAQIKAYEQTEKEAQALAGRLTAVKSLQDHQTRFSILLNDLAKVTPQGAYINAIALTEDAKKPVTITATANSYNAAAGLRDAFASSPRIQAVDLISINGSSPREFQVELSVSFKPGSFK